MSSRYTIPTIHFPRAIFSDDFKDVYEPAEDSFILLDALEADLDLIRKTTTISLECGSGSGIITTALSTCLNSSADTIIEINKPISNTIGKVLMLTTDINELACKTTRRCANYNKQNDVHIVCTNLADGLTERLENQIDLLIFNPPYVPTEVGEKIVGGHSKIGLAWAGGSMGRDLIDIFLKKYVPRLLSKPHGQLYLVALDQNGIEDLLTYLVDGFSIKGEVVIQRTCGIEKLYVLRYRWI